MSYTKITDFAAKDALITGNPAKLVKGTEIGAEFDAIVTDNALKALSGVNADITSLTAIGDGAVATPSIAHTGDPNTGMWFPAADTIAFSAAGGEVLRMATGSLTVTGDATLATSAQVLLDDSITAAGAALPLAFDTDADTGFFRPAANTLAIANGAAETWRFGSAGQIGIAGATYGTVGQALNSGGASAAPTWGYPVNPSTNDFRLTLTTGTPVTTADVTAATTIYCTPYKGNRIALFDGTNWNVRASAEFSLALGTLTSAKPYDVFCYDNAGTPTLEFLAWTSDTARATALVYQDGVLVKTGATTRRYLGTFYTTSTTQTEDSKANRYLWNYCNRVVRYMDVTEATTSWTYTTATFRQARASSANQLNVVVGVSEDAIHVKACGLTTNTAVNTVTITSIGLDSTSAIATGCHSGSINSNANATANSAVATLSAVVSAGRHYFAWLEYSVVAGTTTWIGTPASAIFHAGISGEILA